MLDVLAPSARLAVVRAGMTAADGGARYVYQYATRATEDGSPGKVVVSDGFYGDTLRPREFELFAHLFGLAVRAEDVSPPAAGDAPSPWFGGAGQ